MGAAVACDAAVDVAVKTTTGPICEPNMVDLLYHNYGTKVMKDPRNNAFGDVLKWANDTPNSPVWYDGRLATTQSK